MKTRHFSYSALVVVLFAFAVPTEGAPKKKRGARKAPKGSPPVNVDAKNIAKAIPVYNPKMTKNAAENQMRQLIHLLAKTNRDSVSSNSALIDKAMDFRDDIGAQQKITTTGSILKAWEIAFDYGAIRNNQFTGFVTRGRYEGEQLIFENIVPKDILPNCDSYIGNLRLVPKSQARKQSTPLDERDKAYATGLQQVMIEAKNHAEMLDRHVSKVGHLALSPKQHEERWLAEVAATGDLYKQLPNLQIVGQRMGTPSKANGFRNIVRVEVTNMSRHPTLIEIESTIVGYTENKNKIYEMRKDRRFLKLRRSEVHEFVIKTPNINVFKPLLKKFDPGKSERVIYRGFTVVAKYDGELVAATGSDGRMARVATGEHAEPAKITQVSRLGSIAPAPSMDALNYDLVRFETPADMAAGKKGTVVSSGLPGTAALMADANRLYRLDTKGELCIYESASFNASSKVLGTIFAGANAHSLFCDGTNYYIHLSQPAAAYSGNDVVKFSSMADLVSGTNGTVMGQAAPGSASFMADGKSFYKIHHGKVQQALLQSRDLNQLMINGEFGNEGKLFCGEKHSGIFSDGSHYYIQVNSYGK
ncbi:MAG: hypothetical protein P1V20_30975 [Verrucomicrobiales bacterium]|nr:hypothetical protein [Verrucomicrobiales bacterium]